MIAANRLPLVILAVVLAYPPGSAHADDAPTQSPITQAPTTQAPTTQAPTTQAPIGAPIGQAPVLVPVYPAPLVQQTQTTYVPQSVAMSGPEEITDVGEDRPPPLGYTAVRRPRKHLIVGGAVTLGATYLTCALAAAAGQDSSGGGTNSLAAMWIPVAGPFIELGQSNSATGDFFLISAGAAQLAGALMLYYGLTTTSRVFVRNDLVSDVIVSPMVVNGASGLALSGRF